MLRLHRLHYLMGNRLSCAKLPWRSQMPTPVASVFIANRFATHVLTWSDTKPHEAGRLVLPTGPNGNRVFFVSPEQTLSDFFNSLQAEMDISPTALSAVLDGVTVAASTKMRDLSRSRFTLTISDENYDVIPAAQPLMSSPPVHYAGAVERAAEMLREASILLEDATANDMTNMDEQALTKQLAGLRKQLSPLEKKLSKASAMAEKRMNRMVWGGLGLLSFQFGLLFRMTYWEYSWDIVEPLSYFVGSAASIAAYVMFIATQSNFEYKSYAERKYLMSLHKAAGKSGTSIGEYNSLKKKIDDIERRLERGIVAKPPADVSTTWTGGDTA